MRKYIVILALVLVASCGVKGDPIRPGDPAASIVDETDVLTPSY